MVDLGTIQTAYYMVAATGVLVAAVFYVLNLRETTKNRRITLTTTMMQPFVTEEGVRQFVDLYMMDWRDFEDYRKKFDVRVNPDSYAKRISMWNLCENLGRLYREGLIDLETLHGGSSWFPSLLWAKFRPIIVAERGGDFSLHHYENWEYVAEKLKEWYKEKYGEDYGARIEALTGEVLDDYKKSKS